MAEFCHTFIDSRSFNALSLLIPCPSPSKSFSTLPLHSPRSLTRRRSSRNRFALSAKSTPPTSSSPALDVISTSEHSDGSVLFRFGDPSEVTRSDGKLNSVKVLDGEQEKHVIDKEIESIYVPGGEFTSKIHETVPISTNDVTKFGESLETTHERQVPASEVVDIDTNGSSGSEVVLGLRETEEQSAVVSNLDDLTVAHDVPQLDKNGNTEKGGSALQEILQESSKGESAYSLDMSSVLISELPSGSAGESSINLNDTTEVHQSEDLVVDANLIFDNEEAVGLSNIIQVAPEFKVVGTESVLDQEVRGDMPGELTDTKELLLSQPILVEEVSHEPEGVDVAPESKVVRTESVLDQEVRGDITGELLDKKELLSQPILVEEVSHEPEGVVVGAESALDQEVSHEPEGVVLVAESVLDQEVSHAPEGAVLVAESVLDQEVSHEPEGVVLVAESVLDQEVSHESEGVVLVAESVLDQEVSHEPEGVVLGAESVLDQEVSGDLPGELLNTKELLSQPILVEEVIHEPKAIEVAPESKVVGAESEFDQEVSSDIPEELLDTKELLSQPILVEEVIHEPKAIEVAPESKVVGAESEFDQEVSSDIPEELLDTKELLSQPILVEGLLETKEIEVAPESNLVGAESEFDQEVSSDIPEELLDTKELLSQPILVEGLLETKEIEVEPESKLVGSESEFDQEVSSDIPEELLDTKELLSQPILVEGLLETKEYEQSQIYVTAANETADVQKKFSTRPMDVAEFVKTEETDLVESLGYGLFKRETVDTHCSKQTNDLIAPAETETEETNSPGENNNLVGPSEQTTISREEMPKEAYVIHCGVSLFPHPKALTGGEDAYFLAGSWFGVADGVSDWSIEGTSPGIYARELMAKCANITSNNSGTSPVDVVNRSVNESPSRGLSTILVAHFDGRVLRVANIGDSRIIVIRNNSIYKRSSLPMHHEFNFPLLIGNGDIPFKFAEEDMIELGDGDVVITATDGLFDNLYEEEIESIISKSLQAKSKPQEIAEILASRAQEVGKSVTCRSPFADEARAAGYVSYAGGKLDDVTVIVSMVKTNIS